MSVEASKQNISKSPKEEARGGENTDFFNKKQGSNKNLNRLTKNQKHSGFRKLENVNPISEILNESNASNSGLDGTEINNVDMLSQI